MPHTREYSAGILEHLRKYFFPRVGNTTHGKWIRFLEIAETTALRKERHRSKKSDALFCAFANGNRIGPKWHCKMSDVPWIEENYPLSVKIEKLKLAHILRRAKLLILQLDAGSPICYSQA